VKVGLFTPGEAFEVVAKRRITQLKEPATKIVGLVTEELRNIMVQGLIKVKHAQSLFSSKNPRQFWCWEKLTLAFKYTQNLLQTFEF